jgi:hypothetical protein
VPKSVRAFLMSRHSLARDIAVVLTVKVVLLVAGYFAFFGPETRVQVTPDGMREHVGIRR